MSSELSNLVWEQRFRPKSINDTILPKHTKDSIIQAVASGKMPNYLFAGTAGVGKTTLARAIAEELGADLLFVNASMNGNIDTLRTTITQFVSTVSFSDSKKIVLLDEADHLNPQSTQPAMRGFLDEFSSNATFILTCNFPSRIIAPLLSRLTVVDFKFNKEDVGAATIQMTKRCFDILTAEGVKFEKAAVGAVVKKNFPDFRKTLVELQRYSSSGEIDSGIIAVSQDSNITELFNAIKGKDFTKCRQWVSNSAMDPSVFYRSLYDKLLPELIPQTIPQIILHINDFQYQSVSSIDQEINQIAFIINAMRDAQFK